MEGQRVLGNILVRHGVVHPDALEGLYDQHREKGAPLVDLVVQNRVATEADVAKALALECGLPFVEKIDVNAVPLEVATRLPISYAKNQKLLLVADYEDRVELVCADPLNVSAIDDVRALVGKEVSVRVAAPDVLIDAINRVYERQDTISELESDEQIADDDQADLLDSDDDAPIIRWVNALFAQAV